MSGRGKGGKGLGKGGWSKRPGPYSTLHTFANDISEAVANRTEEEAFLVVARKAIQNMKPTDVVNLGKKYGFWSFGELYDNLEDPTEHDFYEDYMEFICRIRESDYHHNSYTDNLAPVRWMAHLVSCVKTTAVGEKTLAYIARDLDDERFTLPAPDKVRRITTDEELFEHLRSVVGPECREICAVFEALA